MNKKYGEQTMKFNITNDKLKLEISIKDLVQMFNFYAEEYDCSLKRGKREELIKLVVEQLMSDESSGSDVSLWESMLHSTFDIIIESGEDILKTDVEY